MGKIFNGASCDTARDNCLGTWTKQMERMNSETEKLLQEMDFCHRGPGIYMSASNICSRQAYVCRNQNQGSAITCPPGMVMLWQPFGCFVYPPKCAPGVIPLEKFAPLRQYAIEKHCSNQQSTKRSHEMVTPSKLQCTTWYVECDKSIKDIVYCENGMIYDAELESCRMRKPKDYCVMPDICNHRDWESVSLGDCNRHFLYCRGRTPEEFVCAEGYVFSNGECVPVYQAGSRCWKCRDGEKRHTPFHSCSEYSICKNGRWEETNCPPGMSYFEAGEVCRPNPSCALPVKCKVGKSYHLKCNEYMICVWKGVFEHRVCPPFHRWDIETAHCIPDSDCSPSPEKQCTEGEIIDSYDCEFYHQCSGGKWNRKPCPRYPNARVCTKCNRGRSVSWRTEEQCMEGETLADPQDCASYAVCSDGMWRSTRCTPGLYWNQNLRQCTTSSDCKAFKRADCIHGKRLVGKICNEYLECIHGSWITMQCLPRYAFDTITKQCVPSDRCVASHGGYLIPDDHDITGPSPLFEPIYGTKRTAPAVQRDESGKFCQFGSTVRDEYDCNRFFECTPDGYKLRYCEDDHEFNDESGRCEREYRCDLSRCREGRTIESEGCGHYRICINGIWHKAVCEGGRRFADGQCQATFCSDEDYGVPNSVSCINGNAVADDADCKRYFLCRSGRFREQLCSNGTSFDKKRGYCVRDASCKSKVRCREGRVKADKQDCTAYRVCKGGKFELHLCPNGLIYNHSKKSCEEGSCVGVGGAKNDTCKETGDSAGYQADPLDCRKFYQCAHGKWVSKTCPANLYWNPKKTVCDWPKNVDTCKNNA